MPFSLDRKHAGKDYEKQIEKNDMQKLVFEWRPKQQTNDNALSIRTNYFNVFVTYYKLG